MAMVYSPYVLRNLGHEFGRRRIYFGGVILMAFILLLRLLTMGRADEPVDTRWGQEWQEMLGPVQVAPAADFPYDDGTAKIAERWTLDGGPWDTVPEAERSFIVAYCRDWEAARELAERISPSGQLFAARTGPISAEMRDLGADPGRRIWVWDSMLFYCGGGNAAAAGYLEENLGDARLDGREEDPEGWTVSRAELFKGWEGYPYLIDILLIGGVGAVFLVLAVKAPKGKTPLPGQE